MSYRLRSLFKVISIITILLFVSIGVLFLIFKQNIFKNNPIPLEKAEIKCYSWDTEGTISGILHFGSYTLKKGNEEKTWKAWFIKLEAPICVTGIDSTDYPRQLFSDTVWINLPPSNCDFLLNKKVIANVKLYTGCIIDDVNKNRIMIQIRCQIISINLIGNN
ncbi:MAG: hypothetical protein JW870_05160 [Candidatus Delongbacteria bacterium]|nr:hypothetical protein [Candidatus Delongbacteria bacterium]